MNKDLEKFWGNISKNDLEQLQTYFIGQEEYGGIPIVKDNCEDLFEQWSENLTIMDLEFILQ